MNVYPEKWVGSSVYFHTSDSVPSNKQFLAPIEGLDKSRPVWI